MNPRIDRLAFQTGVRSSDCATETGEIKCPITDRLEPTAPYERIALDGGDGTRCGACHDAERPATEVDVPGAFVSRAYRPVDRTSVPVDEVRRDYETCDPAEEPERCALLSALFGGGEIHHQPFPDDLPTIFE